MAGPPYSRQSRDFVFTPAAGSKVEVKQYNSSYELESPESVPGVIFDIVTGVLVDTFKNQNTTNSGGVGGEDWTRTGLAWNYVLTLSFPAALIGGTLAAAFAQQLVGSNRSVWMRFFMGDPEFWDQIYPGQNVARSFLGRRSLASVVEQRTVNDGDKVVGLNIAGVGIGLLLAFEGDTQRAP